MHAVSTPEKTLDLVIISKQPAVPRLDLNRDAFHACEIMSSLIIRSATGLWFILSNACFRGCMVCPTIYASSLWLFPVLGNVIGTAMHMVKVHDGFIESVSHITPDGKKRHKSRVQQQQNRRRMLVAILYVWVTDTLYAH